jgi:hypothetical protein
MTLPTGVIMSRVHFAFQILSNRAVVAFNTNCNVAAQVRDVRQCPERADQAD